MSTRVAIGNAGEWLNSLVRNVIQRARRQRRYQLLLAVGGAIPVARRTVERIMRANGTKITQ
jgi:hypothetical protein